MYSYWKHVAIYVLSLLGIGSALPAIAQITPDETLGAERSRVTRNVGVRGQDADRIDGGAGRGANLFHSFSEFNVNEGQRVYFANPTGVENILSRVTGRDVSDIMGTLGVDGGANLFLLNPNGIIFGPNARLDISGSFTASTANSLIFSDGGQFSATNPQDSSLLSVTVPLGVQYGPSPTGAVTNAGLLSVGQNLTLSGGSVTSTGQLAAPFGQLLVEGKAGDVQVGAATAQTATFSASNNLLLPESQLLTTGDLNLLAGNTVWIRDSAVNPFVAQAGGNLTIQGNQGIDIFALNHPASGLVSGGDMVLRSANTVGGDAHYWTGGNFRIERLDGSLGNLFSPYDPVIRSSGDVAFRNYEGASLHIFAGGSVTAGSITITGEDLLSRSVIEDVILSDGVRLVGINSRISGSGKSIPELEPTLDIRAGTTAVGTPLLTPVASFPGATNGVLNRVDDLTVPPENLATSSEIKIGSINFCPGDVCLPGQVFLTNQYFPNQALPNGAIKIQDVTSIESGSISASILTGGSSVVIDSREDIIVKSGINAGSRNNAAGSILLVSGGKIDTSGGSLITEGITGGDVILEAAGSMDIGSISSSVTRGNVANAGSIRLEAGGTITADSHIESFADGRGGDITLVSRNGRIDTSAGTVRSSSFNGDGGAVGFRAFGNIVVNSIESFVGINGQGNGGDIILDSRNGSIDTTAGIIQSSAPRGSGGDISITALRGDISTNAIRSFVGAFRFDPLNGIDFSMGRPGNGGNIELRAGGTIRSSGRIASFAGGNRSDPGNAGDISLRAGEGIDIISARSFVGTYDEKSDRQGLRIGNAGDILLFSRVGDIRIDQDPGDLLAFSKDSDPTSRSPSDTSPGYSQISLIAEQGSVFLNDARLSTTNSGTINAGDVIISAGDEIEITNGSELESRGFFGIIFITSPENSVVISNSTLNTDSLRRGGRSFSNQANRVMNQGQKLNQAGLIRIDAGRLSIDSSRLTASIDADSGSGGFVEINVLGTLLRLDDKSEISASALGRADGGNVKINAENGFVLADPLENSDIIASAADGKGGEINITTNAIFGLEERDPLTLLSDINVSSEFNSNGEVVLNTLGIDPSRNPSELPLETVDAASLVVEGCLGPNRSGVEDQGEFVQSGRGGLSPRPTDPLSGETTTPPLATLNNEQNQSSDSIPPDVTVQRLVEAQKLRQDANGKVSLVAERSTVPPISPVSPANICP